MYRLIPEDDREVGGAGGWQMDVRGQEQGSHRCELDVYVSPPHQRGFSRVDFQFSDSRLFWEPVGCTTVFPHLLIRRMIWITTGILTTVGWAIHKIAETLPRSFTGADAFKRTWDSNASRNGERGKQLRMPNFSFSYPYSFESAFGFLPSSPSFIPCLSSLFI